MFCSNCGKKLNDSASFCDACGTKVIYTSERENADSNTVLKSTVDLPGQRKNMVSNDTMKNLGIKKTIYQERVESVDDREVNDRLFTLYQNLIAPVQKIEEHMYNIENRSKIFNENVVMDIPGKVGCIVGYILAIGLIDLICVRIPSLAYAVEESKYGYTFFFLAPLPLGYLLMLFLSFLLSRLQKNILHSKQRKARLENEEEYQKVSEIINEIKPYIAFVPPMYRTSSALSSFHKSYLNSRASNLEQAIRVYDKDKKHQETMDTLHDGFNMIAEMNTKILTELRAIRYEQITMQAQLERINTSIWAANFMF